MSTYPLRESAIVAATTVTTLSMLLALAQAEPEGLRSIEAEGTQFKVTLMDGRVLRSLELVGAVLVIVVSGRERRLRIDAIEPDPDGPARATTLSSQVFLNTISIQADDGSWQNVCQPGPDGRRQAFLLAGRTRPDATIWPAESGAFEIICTGGAQGKCVRFGYRPWERAPEGYPSYDLYNACVRMVRADYSGDGKGTTRDGQLIDLYDRFGIQKPENDPSQEFEAGWTKDGAVCVRHVRVAENASLEDLESLPSLRGRTGDICTEEFARARGAAIFNRSAVSKTPKR
jgi:hypothetical protein